MDPSNTTLESKTPPHSIEAEQAVLGGLLCDWSAMALIVSTLKADRFYSLQNQIIYDAFVSLYAKGIQGDTLSLVEELRKQGKLEQAGGAGYSASLTELVPSASNIEHYADLVNDFSTRRELIKTSGELRSMSFEYEKDSKAILDEAEKKIFSLAERNETATIHSIKNIVVEDIEIIQARYNNKSEFSGIPSGFSRLDAMTSGFQPSELIIIGARPSIGKTALALSMMTHIAMDRKISCGFFSLEMPYESIGMRLLSMSSHVDMSKIRAGWLKQPEVVEILNSASLWFESPLYTVDTPNMRLLELRSMARRMVSNHQVKIIFIDYIGLITTENPSAPVYEQVSEISKSLKALARELHIPIVALCQVARDAEGHEPNLAQLRGSGSIEQDADVVMFIDRDRKRDESSSIQPAKIILAKQRNGPTGDIDIMFIPSTSTFVNKSED